MNSFTKHKFILKHTYSSPNIFYYYIGDGHNDNCPVKGLKVSNSTLIRKGHKLYSML